MAIQGYFFTIVHRRGIHNVDDDALSRRDQVLAQVVTDSAGDDVGDDSGDVSGDGSGDASGNFSGDQNFSDVSSTFFTGGDGIANAIKNLKENQLQDTRTKAILEKGVKLPFFWNHGLLYYQLKENRQVPVIPANMVKAILKKVHDIPTGGHLGVDKTTHKAKRLG